MGETNNFSDIEKTMKRDTCICVKKCLNKELCSNFDNYFDIIEHNKRTRQGGLRLPVIKLESTKYSFFFTSRLTKFFHRLLLLNLYNFILIKLMVRLERLINEKLLNTRMLKR